MSQNQYLPLTPILQDLETILLRRLTAYHNKATEDQFEASQQVSTDWASWPKLSKQRNSPEYIAQTKVYLKEYLVTQMKAQVAEQLEVKPDLHLDKLVRGVFPGSTQDQKDLADRLSGYPLKVRCFPSYIPDMETMCDYTLRAFSQQQEKLESRELVEAVNQNFFYHLAHELDSLNQLVRKSKVEDPTLFEISFPKETEPAEVFLRAWQSVELTNSSKQWQVANCSIPLDPKEVNPAKYIATSWMSQDKAKISTLDSLGMKLETQTDAQKAMATVVVADEGYANQLISLINRGFEFSVTELHKVSEHIYSLIEKYVEAVNVLLVHVIENLTKPFNPEIDQKWNQLIASIQHHINGHPVDIQQFNNVRIGRRGKAKPAKQIAMSDQGNLFGVDPLTAMIKNSSLQQIIFS